MAKVQELEEEIAKLQKQLVEEREKATATQIPTVAVTISTAEVKATGVTNLEAKYGDNAPTTPPEPENPWWHSTWQKVDKECQHTATPLSSFAGSFVGLGGLSLAQTLVPPSPEHLVVFAASFGALATLLFGAPAAPLGRLRNIFFGHVLSICAAVALHYGDEWLRLTMGWGILTPSLERVLTPSLAIALMVHYKTPHPPAAAIVTFYASLPDGLRGLMFLMFPALFGCVFFVAVQLATAKATRGEKFTDMFASAFASGRALMY